MYKSIQIFVSIPCKNQNFEKMTFIAKIQCLSDKEYKAQCRITRNKYFQYFWNIFPSSYWEHIVDFRSSCCINSNKQLYPSIFLPCAANL